jgi:hypothetical protein
MPAGLVSHDAEELQGVDLPRIRLEDLAINPLGLGEASGLMVLKTDLQRFGNRWHRSFETDEELFGIVEPFAAWSRLSNSSHRVKRRDASVRQQHEP